MTVNSTGLNIGTLMGSLNAANSSGMAGIYNNLSQGKMISSGAYMGLLRNYYKTYDKDGNVKSSDSKSKGTSNSTSADSTKTSNAVKASAEGLIDAYEGLRGATPYEKVKTKDDQGNEKEDYNYKELYKRVSAFVDAYNDVVDRSADSNTKGVLSAASKMVRNTASNASMLAKVGISVGSDNKLSINEESFKTGDMNALKTLFKGAGSFGYQTSLQASMIKASEAADSKKTATYTAGGTYGNNYSSSFSDFI